MAMDNSLYILQNRAMPWGDYGAILLSGMTSHRTREDSLLQLERTGPFVPPITITGFDATGDEHVVVTDALKLALEAATLSALRFLPVIKRHIVCLRWETWDQAADEPAEYPESFEPEDYILARPHDLEIADRMGDMWEVRLEEHARTERERTGPGSLEQDIYLVRSSWDGADWFRASGVGYTYVSEKARRWLEENVGEWVTFATPCVR